MKTTYKKIETINEFIDAIRIRIDVFIIEQKCLPGWDPEELDKESAHYIALVDNQIVAYARLREDPKETAKLENMVVKKEFRKKGIGVELTQYIVLEAKKQGYKKIWMQAQEYAKAFYEKAGFSVTSKPYDLYDLGILHVDMKMQLK